MRLLVWMIGLAACAGRIHDQGADVITVADRSAGPAVDLGCGDPLRGGDTRGLRFVAWQPSCFPQGGEPTGDVTPGGERERQGEVGAAGQAPVQTARR